MVSDEALAAQRSLILYIDIYRIEQVIRNLITNAVREFCLYFYCIIYSSFLPTYR